MEAASTRPAFTDLPIPERHVVEHAPALVEEEPPAEHTCAQCHWGRVDRWLNICHCMKSGVEASDGELFAGAPACGLFRPRSLADKLFGTMPLRRL
jgi:hypothetical protein